jgi:putative hemolysin
MTGIEVLYLILCVVFVLASAFFASAEVAFISLQKVKLRSLKDSGVPGAQQVARIVEHPGKLLSTVLTAINFTETVVAALGSMLIVSLVGSEAIGIPISIVVIAIITLLFAEVIPKTIAASNPERFTLRYADSIATISKVLSPIVSLFSWITDKFSRVIGVHTMPSTLLTREEVRAAISMAEESGIVDKPSADMLKKVLKIGNRQVRDIMTPWAEVVWIEQKAKLVDFLNIYNETPHPRYPAYQDELGNVKGMLATRDALFALAQGSADREGTVAEFLRPAYFVSEGKLVGELLIEMQKAKSETAIVVDQHGAPSGIVTVSQLAQEIMGEIRWTPGEVETGR